MVPGAERQGMLLLEQRIQHSKTTNPETREAGRTSMRSNISEANTGDAASEQDSTYEKVKDTVTPPLSEPKSQTFSW